MEDLNQNSDTVEREISSYKYKKIAGKEDEKCVICIGEYQIDEEVTQLKCNHVFHAECIDTWMTNKNTCPICRGRILETNTTTEELEEENIILPEDMSIVIQQTVNGANYVLRSLAETIYRNMSLPDEVERLQENMQRVLTEAYGMLQSVEDSTGRMYMAIVDPVQYSFGWVPQLAVL